MRRSSMPSSPDARLWPMVTLTLIAVAVPTVCVLWFMSEATENVQLAARQRLAEAYNARLQKAAHAAEEYWRGKITILESTLLEGRPAAAFAAIVETGVFDSAIVQGEDDSYPKTDDGGVEPPDGSSESDKQWMTEWRAAQRLEFGQSPAQSRSTATAVAAQAYGALAEKAGDNAPSRAALALQAQVRCLLADGQTTSALPLLSALAFEDRFRNVRDYRERFPALNAQLLLMELSPDPESDLLQKASQELIRRLNAYSLDNKNDDEEPIPAPQRRFLMRRVLALAPQAARFPTLAAENTAARFLDDDDGVRKEEMEKIRKEESERIGKSEKWFLRRPIPIGDFWALYVGDPSAQRSELRLGLLRKSRFAAEMNALLSDESTTASAAVALLTPDGKPFDGREYKTEPFLTIPAPDLLPEWRVALFLMGEDPFALAGARQAAVYLWTGILVIAVLGALALSLVGYLRRQMRLTRLKNDLIATVSHELKAPLASMRVLTDTLLEGRCRDEKQRGEYLALMAKENARLSRLIDNFLAFSRMERNKRAFEFAEVAPDEIVNAVSEAVRERFESAGARFEVATGENLPMIVADRDALVTVLLNLLDNAFKYSRGDKRIALRAFEKDGAVCFEVKDNGIGISRRATRRIFDRFYQVDQSLSRETGGCGLGLSIVKFIVDAHGGEIAVQSRVGEGSAFTVRLPAARAGAASSAPSHLS